MFDFFLFHSQIWNLTGYHQQKKAEFEELSEKFQMTLPCAGHLEPLNKRFKMESNFFSRVCDDESVIKLLVPVKKPFEKNILPKTILLNHVNKQNHSRLPVYYTEQVDKLFFSTVTLADGKKYANRYL